MTVTKQVQTDPPVESDNNYAEKDQDPERGDDEDDENNGIGPTGRWKYGIFGFGCSPLCLLGFCCDCVVWGQVMSRLGLDWRAMPDPVNAASTFAVVVMLFFAYWASCVAVFGLIFTPCFLCYMILIFTKTRYEARQRFKIPPSCCQCADGVVEDCLVSNFCSCCVTIQIARHTHDEDRYPYAWDSNTGLPENAPTLVEGMSVYQAQEL